MTNIEELQRTILKLTEVIQTKDRQIAIMRGWRAVLDEVLEEVCTKDQFSQIRYKGMDRMTQVHEDD